MRRVSEVSPSSTSAQALLLEELVGLLRWILQKAFRLWPETLKTASTITRAPSMSMIPTLGPKVYESHLVPALAYMEPAGYLQVRASSG